MCGDDRLLFGVLDGHADNAVLDEGALEPRALPKKPTPETWEQLVTNKSRILRKTRLFGRAWSMRFEKLSGGRKGQYSMRLNDQWRLIVAFRGKASTKTIIVMEIVDYH